MPIPSAPFNPISAGMGQGGQQAGDIAATLQNNAQRVAQLAAQRAQLELQKEHMKQEEKIAQQQLDATASEHQKYQQFQAQQDQVNIAAQNARLEKEQAFQKANTDRLFKRQDEMIGRNREIEDQRRQFELEGLKDASGINLYSQEQRSKFLEAQRNNEAEIGANQLEVQAADKNNKLNGDKIYETMKAIDHAKGTILTDSDLATRSAIDRTLTDKDNFKSFAKKIGAIYDKTGSPTTAVTTPLAQLVGDNVSSWFGGEVSNKVNLYGPTPLNNLNALTDRVSEELAKNMQGMANKGMAPMVKGAVKDMMDWGSALYVANKSGTDPDKVAEIQKRFNNSLGILKRVLPDEAVHGVIKAIEDTPDALRTNKDFRISSLFEGDEKQGQKVLEAFGGIGQAFHATVNSEGAPKFSLPSQQISHAFDMWVGAKGMTLNDPELFLDYMKEQGVSPKTALMAIQGMVSRRGKKDLPELNALAEELKKRVSRTSEGLSNLKDQEERLNLMGEAERMKKYPKATEKTLPIGL